MRVVPRHHSTRILTTLLVITSAAVGVAQGQCWTTGTTPKPDSQYVVQSSTGTVVDTVTNLIWKQCHEGRSGTTCLTGTAVALSLDDGNTAASNSRFAGYNDWRLPTSAELQSLLPSGCVAPGPTINSNVFPDTPANGFWSGSPVIGAPTLGWTVQFRNGTLSGGPRNSTYAIRLVRAVQTIATLPPTPQTVTFVGPAPVLPIGGTVVVAATSATPNSANPVEYASTTPTVCSVDASTGIVSPAVGALPGDTCTLSANQPGREYNGQNYAPATQVTQSLTVKGAQSFAFELAPAVTVGTSGIVTATSNQGITPVSFSTATASVCSLSGANNSTVTGVSVGVCTVTASAPGNGSYFAATAGQSFNIGAAPAVCNLRMNGTNPMLASVEGLILTRAMLGLVGDAVTAGTGVTTPWNTLRDRLNQNCGTSFQ